MHRLTLVHRTDATPLYARDQPRRSEVYCDPGNRFTLLVHGNTNLGALLRMDAYSAATAFIRGDFSVRGDVCAAVCFFASQRHSRFRQSWFTLLAYLEGFTIGSLLANKSAVARDISFHYDRSNAFYQLFLDQRMQYEAGSFTTPQCTLEQAQAERLESICRKLELQPRHRMLDIGCGWGGLLAFASEQYGVHGVGCTLSKEQQEFAKSMLESRGLTDSIEVRRMDYRDITGCFDRITSIGMFEHVGRRHLREYFEKVHSLLNDDGLFLNRGIIRPAGMADGPETLFLERTVFPGGELAHLAEVVRAAEMAGLEIEKLEDYRLDYALTCRAWVTRLQDNAAKCISLVGDSTYRTWLLFLAASAVNFEAGRIDAVEIVFRKRTTTTLMQDMKHAATD